MIIDWKNPPPYEIQVATHKLFADYLVKIGKLAPDKATMVKMPDSGSTTWYGLISAARLLQKGATLNTSANVSDEAWYMATMWYNGEMDMERGSMRSNEKPWDDYRELTEPFLALLIQSLLDSKQPIVTTVDTNKEALKKIAKIIGEVKDL